mmetsp:Transcript_40702/g.103600  ORF Transcript_40702/g.103600 Transcript_40702/m.103600 type:complete len:221 (-) Transcript_40702:59-721(-)|eukprot:CAMPEP_0183417498 /NCGR_PEP_ID=MMETSP0370-20130417/24467_1 /TAXON_ID=268820 /ORGANISM="Peridinium aciculiferum, Strain PAER-2" /LENGTH=220 /DNA_ID=CAMNT_0025601095 /DNA_START=77 /DNA_END=739 /DNA_ORIENTATION=-
MTALAAAASALAATNPSSGTGLSAGGTAPAAIASVAVQPATDSASAALGARAAVARARVQRFKALQDVLATMSAARTVSGYQQLAQVDLEACLASLAALLPDSVVQQALHLVDAGDVVCVRSRLGRRFYEVRGKKFAHMVLPEGLYCSCPYFGRRVLEAGELCCKHWLAVQLALANPCIPGASISTGITVVSELAEDNFAEHARQRLVAPASVVGAADVA